jgi:adenosylcobinamide kinase / adenosylcobinamide-phosphate guanylyltransferase
MDKKIIFITGGARSGKSHFAQELAGEFPGRKVFLATAQALDEEMKGRIERHRSLRSAAWVTLEEPIRIVEAIRNQGDRMDLILLDCLTLWISNLMMAEWSEERILAEGDRLLEISKKVSASIILVTNEVGLGIVPDNPMARLFRDLSGFLNQKMARNADEVHFLISGLPQKIKG